MFKTLLPRLGISIRWAKKETREEFEKHIDDKTKMLFVETIGNPRCSIPDLKELGELAHENNVPFVVSSLPRHDDVTFIPDPTFRWTTPLVLAVSGASLSTSEQTSFCTQPPSGWVDTAQRLEVSSSTVALSTGAKRVKGSHE